MRAPCSSALLGALQLVAIAQSFPMKRVPVVRRKLDKWSKVARAAEPGNT
jgi:hypothetical protein